MTDQNKNVLEGIRELTSHIIARAAEIEAARRIPFDIVQSLKSAGVFRMFVPRSHGGLELALPTGLEAIRALGRVDGSVGWTAIMGVAAPCSPPYCHGKPMTGSMSAART